MFCRYPASAGRGDAGAHRSPQAARLRAANEARTIKTDSSVQLVKNPYRCRSLRSRRESETSEIPM